MNYGILHLNQDEHVILEVRKHWIVFVGIAVSLLVMAILPCVLFLLVKIFLPKILTAISLSSLSVNFSSLFLFFYSLWLLFLWLLFFIQWTKYHLDVWYVTEKRIIDVQQKQIFDREISNLPFDKIQNPINPASTLYSLLPILSPAKQTNLPGLPPYKSLKIPALLTTPCLSMAGLVWVKPI